MPTEQKKKNNNYNHGQRLEFLDEGLMLLMGIPPFANKMHKLKLIMPIEEAQTNINTNSPLKSTQELTQNKNKKQIKRHIVEAKHHT